MIDCARSTKFDHSSYVIILYYMCAHFVFFILGNYVFKKEKEVASFAKIQNDLNLNTILRAYPCHCSAVRV